MELCCERLVDHPELGKARDDLRPGYRSIPVRKTYRHLSAPSQPDRSCPRPPPTHGPRTAHILKANPERGQLRHVESPPLARGQADAPGLPTGCMLHSPHLESSLRLAPRFGRNEDGRGTRGRSDKGGQASQGIGRGGVSKVQLPDQPGR
ncbi:MAG: type II toxin-antitoxin system RelE/ParE family toxin [Dehalococcoidia bacterium]